MLLDNPAAQAPRLRGWIELAIGGVRDAEVHNYGTTVLAAGTRSDHADRRVWRSGAPQVVGGARPGDVRRIVAGPGNTRGILGFPSFPYAGASGRRTSKRQPGP